MVLIHKQQLRHMMTERHPHRSIPSPSNTPDVDVEHELAVIHSVLKSNLELLTEWKNKLEQAGHVRLRTDPNLLDKRIDEAVSPPLALPSSSRVLSGVRREARTDQARPPRGYFEFHSTH